MAELEEQKPVSSRAHYSIHELLPETSLYHFAPPAILAWYWPIRRGETSARTQLSTRQISLRCQQPNGLAVEYHAGTFAFLGLAVRATRAPLSHENMRVEGGSSVDAQHVPWYIHRTRLHFFVRPCVRSCGSSVRQCTTTRLRS